MSDPKAVQSSNKQSVKQLARELFGQWAAVLGIRGTQQVANMAFRAAEDFLAVEAQYDAGKLITKQEDIWGADCFARNLPHNHPFNLVSYEKNLESEGRNRERVNRIATWLVKHPEETLAYAEGDLAWDIATTKIARTLFPAYADKQVLASASN